MTDQKNTCTQGCLGEPIEFTGVAYGAISARLLTEEWAVRKPT